MEILSENLSFGGRQLVVKHLSTVTRCDMTFAIYLPPGDGPFPVLWYLSGLTCTHANVMEKGEYRRIAAKEGIAIICPDTSPRGTDVAGADASDWQLGQGASFYVDATEAPYSEHYQMYSYLTDELSSLVFEQFPLDAQNQSIFGHSMGGHGAMVLALRNPGLFKSCSAFAPIVHPSDADWSKRALSEYLGEDPKAWRLWDTLSLIEDGAKIKELFVDQGDADPFLEDGLKPWLLEKVCKEAGIDLELRMQPGYDHSYYFISSFMEDHILWHADRLKTENTA